jgi:hypothetical protein
MMLIFPACRTILTFDRTTVHIVLEFAHNIRQRKTRKGLPKGSVECSVLLLHIQEDTGSDLGMKGWIFYRKFLWVSLVPRKFRDPSSHRASTESFHIVSYSFFVNHFIIRLYIVRANYSVFK